MYLLMTPNDTWLMTTPYYRYFYQKYMDIVSEYITEPPPAFSPHHCPVLDDLLLMANEALSADDEKFRAEMNRQITHIYHTFPKHMQMMAMEDVIPSLTELTQVVEGIVLVFPGCLDFVQSTLSYHGIDKVFPVAMVNEVTPQTIQKVLDHYEIPASNALFVGSSPARELNAAISLGLQCARVYYPDYVLYDEATFEPVPTFASMMDFATTYVELIREQQ